MSGQLVEDDAIEAFARDGVIVLRGILSPAEIELLAVGIDKALAQPSEQLIKVGSPEVAGTFVEDFVRWRDVDEIKQVALEDGTKNSMASGSAVLQRQGNRH